MTRRKRDASPNTLFYPAPLSADGYCSSCNVNVRDVFVHRASETHLAAQYRRATVVYGGGSGMSSARKTSVASAYRALRDYDRQYDDR